MSGVINLIDKHYFINSEEEYWIEQLQKELYIVEKNQTMSQEIIKSVHQERNEDSLNFEYGIGAPNISGSRITKLGPSKFYKWKMLVEFLSSMT